MVKPFRIFLFLLAVLGAMATRAQEITFKATVDRTEIATGESLKLTVSLTNAPMGSSMANPQLGGLVVVQGPFDSNSFALGRAVGSVARTWYLTATQPGDYTIGAAGARVGGGQLNTEPIKVHVTKGQTTGPNSAQLEQAQKGDPNLFCTISVSKNRVYVGEQVIATYTLYSRYNSLQPGDYDLPKLSGFWAEEIDLGDASWEKARQTVSGIPYNVAVIKKQVLLPQHGGKLRIEPMTLNYRVNPSFFSSGTPVRIKSNAAEINVMDLPEGKPTDFIGAVGDLRMEVKVANTTVKANEAIDITVRFSGRANLRLIDAPKLAFPSDFEAYDPKMTDKITVNGNGMSGSREFQYLVIPRHEGDYDIGRISYWYFDPSGGNYAQMTSEPFTFHVEKGDPNAGATISRPSQSDVQELGKDIRYIHTGDLVLERHGHHLFGSWMYVLGLVVPCGAFAAFFLWHRRRSRLLADTQGLRRRGADKVARKRLAAAEVALKADDRAAFYDALGKALEGYFADKFNLGVAEVNASMIEAKLGHLDNGAVARSYNTLLGDAAAARFAPFENRPRQASYDEAAALIRRIEDQLRA